VTVIKINAITVPAESGDELGKRFAARAGAVDGQDGFEGFELLKPTDDRTTWLVVTRWRDEAAFQAWVSSPAFGGAAHGGGGRPGAAGGHGAAGAHGGPPAGAPAHGEGGAPAGPGQGGPAPLAMTSELWSYEVSTTSPGRD
jgi:heme-degrading monooxygenase HmoA